MPALLVVGAARLVFRFGLGIPGLGVVLVGALGRAEVDGLLGPAQAVVVALVRGRIRRGLGGGFRGGLGFGLTTLAEHTNAGLRVHSAQLGMVAQTYGAQAPGIRGPGGFIGFEFFGFRFHILNLDRFVGPFASHPQWAILRRD